MATYNGELYLSEQVESILLQTYQNFEIICIDDCSTDKTYQILKEYKNKYPNIFIIDQNSNNMGSRSSFAKGINFAHGKFIAFSDQDDVWYPNKLEVLYNEIINEDNCAFVYSNCELVDHELNVIVPRQWKEHNRKISGKDFFHIINENTIMGCSMLCDIEFLLEYKNFPVKGFHHDWFLALMALNSNKQVKFIDEVLFKYRRHSSNQINKSKNNKKNKNSITTKDRAIRVYNEMISLDQSFLKNDIIIQLFNLKQMLFYNMLSGHSLKALVKLFEFYKILYRYRGINNKIFKSYFTYILYSFFWKRTID